MAVDKETVKYIAKLSKLKLSEEEEQKFTLELNTILGYMEKLNELETTNVQPLTHIVPLKNIFREDIAKPSLAQEEILTNAPQQEYGHFKVKKIIE